MKEEAIDRVYGIRKTPIKRRIESSLDRAQRDLEDGIQVAFPQCDGGTGAGDYWLIPARVATGGVEWPDELENDKIKPVGGKNIPAALAPKGRRHYYAPLRLIKPGPDPRDCRKR